MVDSLLPYVETKEINFLKLISSVETEYWRVLATQF